VTLNALSHGNLYSPGEPYGATFNNDTGLGSQFVVYCNDAATAQVTQAGSPGTALGSFFLGQMVDTAPQAAGSLGASSLVLIAYEQAAYFAMRFARSPAPESISLEKQYADIHEALWRLFLSASDARAGTPGPAVDWMTLANHNSSSFDYSRRRF
jgi:hypothetical protein